MTNEIIVLDKTNFCCTLSKLLTAVGFKTILVKFKLEGPDKLMPKFVKYYFKFFIFITLKICD
jgi:hypothetical protein